MANADETISRRWRFDSTQWLTPEQQKSVWDADQIIEGTEGELAALLYGIVEARMNYYVARLAILSGDPSRPSVVPRQPDFWCEAGNVHWHAKDRFLCVNVPMRKKGYVQSHFVVAPCVFDLASRTFTFVPLRNASYIQLGRSQDGWKIEERDRPPLVPSHAGEHFQDLDLRWTSWTDMAWASERFFSGWFGTIR